MFLWFHRAFLWSPLIVFSFCFLFLNKKITWCGKSLSFINSTGIKSNDFWLVFIALTCNFKYWLIGNLIYLSVIATQNVSGSLSMSLFFNGFTSSLRSSIICWKGQGIWSVKLHLFLHSHQLFIKLFFLFFLLNNQNKLPLSLSFARIMHQNVSFGPS